MRVDRWHCAVGVLGLWVGVVSGSLGSEFAEVAKGSAAVRTVSCVGPRLLLASGEEAVRCGLGASGSERIVAVSEDVVLVEAREGDTSDGSSTSEEALRAIGAADVIVYAVKGHEVEAVGERRAKYLSGLVAGLEQSASPIEGKRVVVAVEGLDEARLKLARQDALLVPAGVDVVVVDALDGEALRAAAFVGTPRPAEETASRLSASPKRRPPSLGSPYQVARRQAAEVAANKACAAAYESIVAVEVGAAVENLGAAWQLESKFCQDYAEHAAGLVDDMLLAFDKRLPDDLVDTEAYARKRAELARDVADAVDAAYFEPQLGLLAQDAAQHLRTGLKGLRVTKAVKPQTTALLKDAAAYFDSRARTAFGPSTANRHWKARKTAVLEALADYVDERLQVARLQGTYVPDSQLFKWPFPVAFSFHWLLPATLGRVETQQRGLSPRDKQLFNIRDASDPPRFPIPAAVSKFSKNLVASNTNSPVE